MHEEMNRRFNVINAKEHSVQNPVLSSLLSKDSKIKKKCQFACCFCACEIYHIKGRT